MIGTHCNKPLITVTDNRTYFRKRCVTYNGGCGKTFTQRKRQPEVKTEQVTFYDPFDSQRKTLEMLVYSTTQYAKGAWQEYAISTCDYGCKVMRRIDAPGNQLALFHYSGYGCTK